MTNAEAYDRGFAQLSSHTVGPLLDRAGLRPSGALRADPAHDPPSGAPHTDQAQVLSSGAPHTNQAQNRPTGTPRADQPQDQSAGAPHTGEAHDPPSGSPHANQAKTRATGTPRTELPQDRPAGAPHTGEAQIRPPGGPRGDVAVGVGVSRAAKAGAFRLLDVGCGTGVVTAAALALGAEVTAVDADPGMVELTAHRHPYAIVRLATLPGLPFGDGEFDAVAGNFIINHVSDTATALNDLHRVLRPAGTLALTWWKSDEMTATSVFADAIADAGVPYEPPARPFTGDDTPGRFTELLEEAGFSGAKVETVRWRHRVDLASWWSDIVRAGGPRFAVIARQPPEIVDRIRACCTRLAAPYERDGFPVCAYLARATRPAP
ncbi:class I SAM-dependent methyltransferase [Nonomuraea phyllanthi]|uniref:class I SAM-dependent methyltransferase n=1 Tax=Nonomuraea phyllanthi TaxID=2219224 RepID=UPI001D00E725|nr:methyltransferase domain-containing protein [Nonomuraea phyllanthi]